MKVTVQVVLHADDDTRTVLREVFTLNREALAPDTVGLQLQEAKDLLAAVQDTLVEHQVTTALAALVACPDCGMPRRHKDGRRIVMRTVFGVLRLDSPRWWVCPCTPGTARTFSPLAALLRERTTPELSYLQVPFRRAGFLRAVRRPAQRDPAAGPGAARHHGAPAGAGHRATPGGRARRRTVGLHHRLPRRLGGAAPPGPAVGRRPGRRLRPLLHPTDPPGRLVRGDRRQGHARPGAVIVFGYVQTYDSKPKRRLFEVLAAHGMQPNQQVTFLTDGGEDIRDLPRHLNPQAEHLLDWFHLTMRITVMTQLAKGLRSAPGLSAKVAEQLQKLKWLLWHGNVCRARQTIDDITTDLEEGDTGGHQDKDRQDKLAKAVREFGGYLAANAAAIPNYGERRRAGETISTSFVESAVNQVISKRMVKKQQMRWSPRGAHLLLQIRTRVLNDTLADDYRRWYPDFTHTTDQEHLAA